MSEQKKIPLISEDGVTMIPVSDEALAKLRELTKDTVQFRVKHCCSAGADVFPNPCPRHVAEPPRTAPNRLSFGQLEQR